MKIVFILILCAVIIIIGLKISSVYVVKARFYQGLVTFLEEVKLSVSFKKDKLKYIVSNYKNQKHIEQFVLSFQNYLNGQELDIKNVKEIDPEDIPVLEEIILNLGRYNAHTELIQLENFIERSKSRQKQAELDRKKFTPMIIKLSILLSIAIGIILI